MVRNFDKKLSISDYEIYNKNFDTDKKNVVDKLHNENWGCTGKSKNCGSPNTGVLILNSKVGNLNLYRFSSKNRQMLI